MWSLPWLFLLTQPYPLRVIFLRVHVARCLLSLAYSTFIDQAVPPEVHTKRSSHAWQRAGTQNCSLLPSCFHLPFYHQTHPCPITGLQTLCVSCTFDCLPQHTWARYNRHEVLIQERKSGLRAKVFKMKDKFWWTVTRWKPFKILIFLLASYF